MSQPTAAWDSPEIAGTLEAVVRQYPANISRPVPALWGLRPYVLGGASEATAGRIWFQGLILAASDPADTSLRRLAVGSKLPWGSKLSLPAR
jgi:hypothetical protein